MRRPGAFIVRMLRPSRAVALLTLPFVALLGATPATAPLVPAAGSDPSAEAIFARAKAALRSAPGAPFVRFNLLERYTWRNRPHDDWWAGAFRASDGGLALHRTVTATSDAPRLRGTSIGVSLDYHRSPAHVDNVETNASADAFPVLDPLIPPDDAFGLVPGAARAVLAGPARVTAEPEARIAATPVPVAATPFVAAAGPADPPLREIVRVEAVARDYRIALAGHDPVRGLDAYHLTLEPLREPGRYRLRELWVGVADAQTLRLSVAGLFAGKPYDGARWTVDYVAEGGRPYVQQIKTTDTLRFGADRSVRGLEYDFVQYAFPQTIAPWEFAHLL